MLHETSTAMQKSGTGILLRIRVRKKKKRSLQNLGIILIEIIRDIMVETYRMRDLATLSAVWKDKYESISQKNAIAFENKTSRTISICKTKTWTKLVDYLFIPNLLEEEVSSDRVRAAASMVNEAAIVDLRCRCVEMMACKETLEVVCVELQEREGIEKRFKT
jgi:hypothetical protein